MVGNANSFVTLRLTNRICLAEFSSVRCAHITVLDKQQFYWVHFDLTEAAQLHDLVGQKGTQRCTHTTYTHRHSTMISETRGAHVQVNTNRRYTKIDV